MKFILTLALSFISFSQAYCQHDSVYVRNYFNKLIVKPFLGGPQYQLTFDPVEGKDSAISKYTPNTFGIIGITLAYKSFTLNLSKRAGDLKDQDIYGKTKYSLISAKIAPKQVTVEFTYQKYKGYADLKTRNYYKSSPDSLPYIVRNDLQNKYYKLKGIYQINKKKILIPGSLFVHTKAVKECRSIICYGKYKSLENGCRLLLFPLHGT